MARQVSFKLNKQEANLALLTSRVIGQQDLGRLSKELFLLSCQELLSQVKKQIDSKAEMDSKQEETSNAQEDRNLHSGSSLSESGSESIRSDESLSSETQV